MYLWDLQSREIVQVLEGHTDVVVAVSVSPQLVSEQAPPDFSPDSSSAKYDRFGIDGIGLDGPCLGGPRAACAVVGLSVSVLLSVCVLSTLAVFSVYHIFVSCLFCVAWTLC